MEQYFGYDLRRSHQYTFETNANHRECCVEGIKEEIELILNTYDKIISILNEKQIEAEKEKLEYLNSDPLLEEK